MARLYSPHRTMKDSMRPINSTHLGQAHIAGTGPEGRTCRECIKWHLITYEGKRGPYRRDRNGDGMMELQPQKCRHRILNKTERRVPHDAAACRFFEENSDAPIAVKEPRRRKAKT